MAPYFNCVVIFIRYGLQPGGRAFFGMALDGEVHEPAIFGRAVPVFDVGGDVDDVSGAKLPGIIEYSL